MYNVNKNNDLYVNYIPKLKLSIPILGCIKDGLDQPCDCFITLQGLYTGIFRIIIKYSNFHENILEC